jgi:transposase InsO family protein
VRPATPLICAFIDEHADRFGVVPICRALAVHGVQIAPRTYWAHRSAAPSKRALWDATIAEILAGIYEPDAAGKRPPECLYGSLKMWAHLQRQGIPVARCTVERIMRANGWHGATRAHKVRTTVSDPAATRAPDLVRRRFRASRPDELHVADFTYVPMSTGFGYTAFVIDAYAGPIVGWECSLTKNTAFVERAIRAAAARRAREGHPLGGDTIHHSDAGSQYTAIHFTDTLMLAGLIPSIGTVGDALDNALAETTIGLYKTECVREGSPFRTGPLLTLADLEDITSAWVHWFGYVGDFRRASWDPVQWARMLWAGGCGVRAVPGSPGRCRRCPSAGAWPARRLSGDGCRPGAPEYGAGHRVRPEGLFRRGRQGSGGGQRGGRAGVHPVPAAAAPRCVGGAYRGR